MNDGTPRDEFLNKRGIMTILSLTVDDQLANQAQFDAAECNTPLNHLLLEFLVQLTSADHAARDSAADRLKSTIRNLSRPMGGKPYRDRHELFDR